MCRFGEPVDLDQPAGALRHTGLVLLAHVGHWALWVLYAIPVVVVLSSIAINLARDRRQRRGDAGLAAPDSS
jgi:hypothetical protein